MGEKRVHVMIPENVPKSDKYKVRRAVTTQGYFAFFVLSLWVGLMMSLLPAGYSFLLCRNAKFVALGWG